MPFGINLKPKSKADTPVFDEGADLPPEGDVAAPSPLSPPPPPPPPPPPLPAPAPAPPPPPAASPPEPPANLEPEAAKAPEPAAPTEVNVEALRSVQAALSAHPWLLGLPELAFFRCAECL